jgi:hypothetical protein
MATYVGHRKKTWTPARLYLLGSVLFLFPAGITGLLANQNFAVGANATAPGTTDMVFGVLETNGWHSSAALINGAAALLFLAFASDRAAARGALSIGIGLAGLAVALMIPTSIHLLDNVIASNAADNFTHAAQGIGGIVTGLIGLRATTTATPVAVTA